ncbi:MAG: hypothetical protein HPZ91_07190 [Lentisphaeria bacterium]|nr:hypothetical protein [Lentisphaeria bacterium]
MTESKELEREYSFSDGKFYSVENGKCVAELSPAGEIVFGPGFKGPHTATLTAWIERNGLVFNAPPEEPDVEGPGETSPAAQEGAQATNAPLSGSGTLPPDVNDIPDDLLPPFDRVLGTRTPGFAEFVNDHKFDKTQLAALIRRLERR